MADDDILEVPRARLKAIIDVLSLLAIGEYDPALSQLELSEGDDPMSFLEQGLDVFIRELAQARRENAAYVETLEDKLETIERQRLAIRELSTPMIELWDEILTLPIVGLVDTQRSIEMTEELLERVSKGSYSCVIIDVTGVDVIDTMTADHFAKMIRGAELLGAHCVVTGLRANLAQTMAAIGVELGGVPTLRSLKEGLKHCLRHIGRSKGGR